MSKARIQGADFVAKAAPSAHALSTDWEDVCQTLRLLPRLTKPTISLLVVVTTAPSLLWANLTLPSSLTILGTLLGVYLASAGAAVFNHIVDEDIDRYMVRTQQRPLPSGKVSRLVAICFAVVLTVGSSVVLWHFASPLAMFLALAGNAFYVFVYTMYLKKRTTQNIVIGGAAGAVGPLIGWAAVTGSLSWEAWALFLIIFLWTPPHFWALALKYKEDYRQAGIPMFPVVHGDQRTHRQILGYTLALVPCVAILYIFAAPGMIYLLIAGGLTLGFVWKSLKLWHSKTSDSAMSLFHYSCFYLFGVFGGLALDFLLAVA